MTDDHASPEPSESILLVDDNPTNLHVLWQTLHGRGPKLLIAQSGEEALDIARKAHPALILLDIMLPGIDGFETCRQLKADRATRQAAVLFLSALDDTHAKVHGLELGAVDYITKPFQAEEVIARVTTHLTLQRLQHRLLPNVTRNWMLRTAVSARSLDAMSATKWSPVCWTIPTVSSWAGKSAPSPS